MPPRGRRPDVLADARTVPPDEVVAADVCVVGAGPAGMIVASELERAGLEVVLLERGDADYHAPDARPDTGVAVGLPYAIDDSRAFALGGSLHLWHLSTPLGDGFGRLRPLDALDFERREGVPRSGWPFSKDHLAPYYARAAALFATGWPPPSAAPPAWASAADGLRRADFVLGEPGAVVAALRRRLERSVDVLVLTHAAGVELRAEGAAVDDLRVASAPGRGFTVVARRYVLASGGIETPRLLLASRGRSAAGLGNEHDLVGRHFMEHPHLASGVLTPDAPARLRARQDFAPHLRGDVIVQTTYGLTDDVRRSEGLPGCAYLLDPRPRSARLHALRKSPAVTRALEATQSARRRGTPATARVAASLRAAAGAPRLTSYGAHRAAIRARHEVRPATAAIPQVFLVRAMAEQLPNPDSRVVLDDARDAHGVPLARLDWRLTAQDTEGYRRSQRLLGEQLRRTGARRVESLLEGRELPPSMNGGAHHMGTTRMSDSPRRGVVDRHGRVHGTDNLYVAGSAVFPTVGYANPTLTIVALALRLADHLAARR